jgi:hypothetical protein
MRVPGAAGGGEKAKNIEKKIGDIRKSVDFTGCGGGLAGTGRRMSRQADEPSGA